MDINRRGIVLSENKGTDQLYSYCTADLFLFSNMFLFFFSDEVAHIMLSIVHVQ